MKQALFSIACTALLVGPQALQARDRGAAPAAKDAAPKEETIAPANVPPYVLKNRSKFDDPGESARVPFWPVGWTKQKQAAIAVAVAAAPKLAFDPKSFHVTSILIGGGASASLAVINRRSYGEGEFLRDPNASTTRTLIRVERINDGTVTLSYDGKKIVLSLDRHELNQHRPEDDVLSSDR